MDSQCREKDKTQKCIRFLKNLLLFQCSVHNYIQDYYYHLIRDSYEKYLFFLGTLSTLYRIENKNYEIYSYLCFEEIFDEEVLEKI